MKKVDKKKDNRKDIKLDKESKDVLDSLKVSPSESYSDAIKRTFKDKFKRYTQEELDKFCEDHFIDWDFGLWEFIEDMDCKLSFNDYSGVLTIKIQLKED